MIWPGFKSSPQSFVLVVGVLTLILIVFWVLKIRNIQRLKMEVVQLETNLSKGQEVWKNYPPLTPEERRNLQKAQDRLFRLLPRDKDIPPILQEITRLAEKYSLSDISFNTGKGVASPGVGQSFVTAGGATQVVVPRPIPLVSSKVPGSSGPIDSFPIRVAFAGDYRETAYFLEALHKIPRLITIQSLQLRRGVPLVAVEVVLNAYYRRDELSAKVK